MKPKMLRWGQIVHCELDLVIDGQDVSCLVEYEAEDENGGAEHIEVLDWDGPEYLEDEDVAKVALAEVRALYSGDDYW